MVVPMIENDDAPFRLSPKCLAEKTATPEAERRDRPATWFLAAMPLLSALPAGFMIGREMLGLLLPPALAACWWLARRRKARFRRRRDLWNQAFPAEFEAFLLTGIPHYRRLEEAGRELFRQRAKIFLEETVFHGAGVEIDDRLRLCAAAAAVIPTLGFPEWQWPTLREIIFRPEGYADACYADAGGVVTEFEESGMMGVSGILSGVMMLSAEDLAREFADPEDGENVGFHEFAHLMAGEAELPAGSDRAGWSRLLERERRRLDRGESLLDEYAFLNGDELFASASELFFTIPRAFRLWHRELYATLKRAYRQDPCQWLEDHGPPPETPPRRRRRRGKRLPARRRDGKRLWR